MGSRNTKLIAIGITIYLLSTVLSYFVFSNTGYSKKETETPALPAAGVKEEKGSVSFNKDLPKTEECPINGVKYSKEQRKWWEVHRPLGVMIENHKDARPQSGLSSADVVYEAVAEGGITRFLSVFYCQDAPIVGPVRSARTYFLDFISEYGNYPLYVHVGGANTAGPADALSQIEKYGWQAYNDLNQFSISFPTFWQDKERLGHPVATEHTMYSSPSKLWKYAAEKRKLTDKDKNGKSWDTSFISYKFKEDDSASDRPQSQIISFDFWEKYADYSVKWEYNKATNLYLRSNGREKHLDKNTNAQLSAKNIVILFMTEKNANDGYENNLHLLYGTRGSGKALILMDGKKINGTWVKQDRLSRTIIKDGKGAEIEFNRGLIWFEIVSTGSEILVE